MTTTTNIQITIRAASSTFEVRRGSELVAPEVIDVGGNAVDAAITDFIRTSAGIEIGPRTAERIKIELGGLDGSDVMNIKGRSSGTHGPASGPVLMSHAREIGLGAMDPLKAHLVTVATRSAGPVEVELKGGGALLWGLRARLDAVWAAE